MVWTACYSADEGKDTSTKTETGRTGFLNVSEGYCVESALRENKIYGKETLYIQLANDGEEWMTKSRRK